MAIVESARIGALLERDELLGRLRTAFADAGAGHGALVGGEAGVGKTTAARLFFEEADHDAFGLWGRCDPLATPPPLGPFLEVVRRPVGGRRCDRCPTPLPGATYGSFGAACHYKDGTFAFQASQESCATKSPQTGSAFNFWHPDLVTLHLWAWYPNPSGVFSGMNPLMRPFNGG